MLRHRARRRPRARERQRRRVRVRRRPSSGATAATRRRPGRCGRTWPRPWRTWSRCGKANATTANRVGERARLLRPDAAFDQPRRLFRQAGVFVLGRLLGLHRLSKRRRAGHGPGPRRRRTAPGRAARRVPRRPAGIARGQHRALRPRRAARGRRPRRLRSDLEHGRAQPRRPAPCAAPPAGSENLRPVLAQLPDPSQRRSGRRSPWRRRLHALRMAQRRRVRSPGRAAAGPRGHGLLPCRPPAERMEPVGRGRAARCARAALSRRHAARVGRLRPDPLRARPLRLRGRGRVVARAGGRRAHGLAGRQGTLDPRSPNALGTALLERTRRRRRRHRHPGVRPAFLSARGRDVAGAVGQGTPE